MARWLLLLACQMLRAYLVHGSTGRVCLGKDRDASGDSPDCGRLWRRTGDGWGFMALSASLASADSAPRSAMTESSCRAGCRWRTTGASAGAEPAAGFLAALGFRSLGEPSIAAFCTSWDCMHETDQSLRSLAVAAGLHLISMLLRERNPFVDMPMALLDGRDGSQGSDNCHSRCRGSRQQAERASCISLCVAPGRQRTGLTVWAGALSRSRLGQADGASGFLWPSALVDTSSMSASASACRSRHPSSLLYMQHTDSLMGTRQGPMCTEACHAFPIPGRSRSGLLSSLKIAVRLGPQQKRVRLRASQQPELR